MKTKDESSLSSLEVVKNITSLVSDQMFNAAKRLINNNIVYSVDVSDIMWMIEKELQIAFPNLRTCALIDQSEQYKRGYKIEYIPDARTRGNSNDGCMYPIIYNNTLIVLSVSEIRTAEDTRTLMSLKTLKHPRNIKVLHKLIDQMTRHGQKRQEKEFGKIIRFFYNNRIPTNISSAKLRTFGDIFIPQKQKAEIQHALNKYTSSRDWYIQNNIPNHFGILLYGPPGTGKTSIAQAITSYVKGQLNVVVGDRLLTGLDNIFCYLTTESISMNKYRILLIEDIDTSNVERNRVAPKNDSECGLGSLLNIIDGIDAPSNIIYIFTTNHVEKLDPALIRPGRIDLKLEIGYVTEETFKEFIKFHYKTNGLASIDVRDGLTFAELQTKIMEGYKLHELIDYVTQPMEDYDEYEEDEYEDYI